jgi:voltage-gated sodium channel
LINLDLHTIKNKLSGFNASKIFQASVIAVIIFSALTIGLKTYSFAAQYHYVLAIIDTTITIFFAFEISIRFLATENKRDFLKNGWNVFDTIIVIGSLIPAAGSSILLGRLLRVFRVLRLVSMVPELRLLVNALVKAIPRMGYIVILMFVIFYIYGAAGSILFEKINPILWGDVAISMLTLFRIATLEDWTDVMYETQDIYPFSWLYYLSFIFFTAFVFLNMMVGTILDVMNQEQELHRAQRHGESAEGAEPASRAQVNKLESEVIELKALVQSLKGTD